MKTVNIIQNTFVAGKLLVAGEEPVEMEDSDARMLVDNSKAEYCKIKPPIILCPNVAHPKDSMSTDNEKITETKKPFGVKRRKNHEDN